MQTFMSINERLPRTSYPLNLEKRKMREKEIRANYFNTTVILKLGMPNHCT